MVGRLLAPLVLLARGAPINHQQVAGVSKPADGLLLAVVKICPVLSHRSHVVMIGRLVARLMRRRAVII
jgi:hypothetical protein